MQEIPEKQIAAAIEAALTVPNIRKATAYVSDKLTVKATHQRRTTKRDKSVTLLVSIGQPNFVERRFIRICKKAGMVFPLRQVQFKFWKSD